jgi:23S rRNA (uracil1939-C5)-methyltransferase
MKLNIGDKIKLDIRKQGINGEGIGYYQKVAVFVPGAIIKEIVNVEIVQSFSNYAIAKVLDTERVSKRRVNPLCKYYDECGGCQMQHIEYKEQLKIKQSIIKQSLRRYTNVNINNVLINRTLGMNNPYKYRNKSQMPFRNTNFGLALGFYKPNSNHFVYVDECIVHHDMVNTINQHTLKLLRKHKQKAYDFRNKEGILFYLVVRYLEKTDSASVTFVVSKKTDIIEKIAEELLSDIKAVKSVSYTLNSQSSNLVISNPVVNLVGVEKIDESYKNYSFKISPDAFHQMNSEQMSNMYDLVLDLAQLKQNMVVFDLYCGIGITSILLGENARKVYGIDYNKASIDDANENKKINNIKNVEFIQDHVEGAVPKLVAKNIVPDLIVLDPPRKGMSDQVIEMILKTLPKQIVYISCNPSTLAKNISELNDSYKVISVNPIDMFPQSANVESVTLLHKKVN